MDDGFQHSVSVVSDLSVLTYVQANQLLQMLDNTKAVIENYVQILEENSHVKHKVRQKSWWGRHCWPNKRRILYKYVTIITLCLQVFNLLVLTVIDAWPRHDTGEHQFMVASSTTMIIMQVLNLILIILASGRLVKQIYRHSVNNFFLAQAYLATLLLFAGIYTTTYRMDVSHTRSWKFVNEDLNEDPAQVFVLYAKFLFYSISTATLCGSDNVLPVEWYNCIFAGIQMLLSFCYFASILGIAMAPDVTSFFKSTNLKSKKDAASSPATQEEQQQQQQQQQEQQQLQTFDDRSISVALGSQFQSSSSTSHLRRKKSLSHDDHVMRSEMLAAAEIGFRRERTLSAILDITGKHSPKTARINRAPASGTPGLNPRPQDRQPTSTGQSNDHNVFFLPENNPFSNTQQV